MKKLKCYILTIGDEILYGQINDTNARWLGEKMASLGFQVVRKVSVGDSKEDIIEVLSEGMRKAEVILMTGGLGPTVDDKTKEALATFFQSPMVHRQEILEDISVLFSQPVAQINRLNRTQANVPEHAEIIRNKMGTAPGLLFELPHHLVVALPGVPHEMRTMINEVVGERLIAKFDPPVISHQMIRTIGIPESVLADKLASWENNLPHNIKLAYLPRLGQVRMRLTGHGQNLQQVQAQLQEEARKAHAILGNFVYSLDNLEIEEAIGKLLMERHQTLAIAESCTGGLVANTITLVPGCSAYFLGGIVAYSNEIKEAQLGVSHQALEKYGAVSEQVALEMAVNVRKKYKTTYGISTTGIAGPGGGTPEKPVGTVWIAYADAEQQVAKKLSLSHDRVMNINWTFQEVMNLLRLKIIEKKA